ncbi:MAG: tetratricopeptide repeat protein [Candidatus Eisenbacteria sp.]|nr:tetratricopeptide repeat protein [Candidatus Eisenbacteria bacterium]
MAGFVRMKSGWFILIAALALLVRLVYQVEVRNLPEYAVLVLDPHIHDSIARAIAAGNVVGDEVFFRSPFYLYLLGFLYFIFGPSPWTMRILQALLGAATSVLAYRIGRSTFSEWTGRIAGLVTALTWTLVYFDGELLITSLATFLDLLLIDRLLASREKPAPGRWLVSGIVLGLSAIARPTILVFGWLAVLWIWWVLRGSRPPRDRLRAMAVYILGSLMIILPVTLRNAMVGKDFVLIASQGGINFYLGNNPESSGWSATSQDIGRDWWGGFDDAVWIAEGEEGRDLKPSEVSRYWTRRGLQFWANQPGKALDNGVRKLFFFWGAAELGNNRDIEFFRRQSWVLRILPFSFGWLVPLGLVGMIAGGCVSGKRRDRVLLALFVLLYMASVVLFFVCARFRMPVVPVLAVLAAAGGGWLVAEIRTGNARKFIPIVAGVLVLTAILRLDLYGVRDPTHSQSHFNLGLAYARLQDDARAEAAYLETLRRNPDYADALNNLGGLYTRQGRWEEARALFERGLAKDPGSARFAYNLGVVSENAGVPGEAETRYRDALDADSHFLPAAVALAGVLERRGALREARRFYHEAYDAYSGRKGLGPGDIRVRFEEEAEGGLLDVLIGLGRIARLQGEWTPMLKFYRQALDLAPEAPEAHYRVGFALMRMGTFEEALSEMEAELERYPDSISARYALGLCYDATGSIVPAIREFRAVIQQDPTHDRAWQNLGVIYARSESYDEAVEAFERTIEINPDNRRAREFLELAKQHQSTE